MIDLHNKLHVHKSNGVLLPANRKLKKISAWSPCCYFTFYRNVA